jgi:6-phosphofructokinase 1
MLSNAFGWRGEFQVTESLQMCAADRAVKLDYDEAYNAGREAVRLAVAGKSGVMVTIERASRRGQPYKSRFATIPLKEVAINARPMDDRYIDSTGMFVTKAFRDYAAPLVGELPRYASLKIKRAKTKR